MSYMCFRHVFMKQSSNPKHHVQMHLKIINFNCYFLKRFIDVSLFFKSIFNCVVFCIPKIVLLLIVMPNKKEDTFKGFAYTHSSSSNISIVTEIKENPKEELKIVCSFLRINLVSVVNLSIK